MIRIFFDWLFDIIFGIKKQERKDIQNIKNLSVDEKEALIEALEKQVIK